eukprot:Phypoly_transcript_03521.p1 GENE.Phypoly_transcript_03521~~Phypoly_transcript_03521.p1  ORF type:complete len:697 (+),score=125.84 Phypoly_transcript_03521:285-2093(+)
MECSIGVSTGKAFCGNYGSKGHNRKEYTVIGDSVNTAARLMQKANKNILCDNSSYKFATTKVWFESLDPVTLKGYDQPVPVFKPDHVRISNRKSENSNRQLFGRSKELEILMKIATAITRSTATNKGSFRKKPAPEPKELTNLVVVEGDQGVGKTTLVDVMLQPLRGKRIKIVESNSDPYRNNGPLHGIWPIFKQSLGLSKDVVSNRLRILSVVADNQNWMRLVPLLNKYLPLDFPSNALCNELSDNARMESTIYLVTQMLRVMAKDKPMIIVFENAQWLDRQSWVVFSDLIKRVSQVLVIVVMRPVAEPPEALTLLKPNLVKIKLDLLDKETTLQIVLQHIGAKRFPPRVSDVIFTRAQGNPLMCVEVAHYLLNSGLMVIGEDGECSLTTELDVASVDIPSSLEAMITARIDKLLPGPLLTLKVAAIIGKSFSFKLLESIYPIPDAKQELMENLLTLRKLNILDFESPPNSHTQSSKVLEQVNGKVCYTFKDCLYMEVAYNLMLFAQKRLLHEQVAKFYEIAMESIARNNQSKLFSFLIRHWEASGNKEKAQHYARRVIVVERWATLRKVLLSQRIVGRFLAQQKQGETRSYFIGAAATGF